MHCVALLTRRRERSDALVYHLLAGICLGLFVCVGCVVLFSACGLQWNRFIDYVHYPDSSIVPIGMVQCTKSYL